MTRDAFNTLWHYYTGTHHFRGKAWKIMRRMKNITATQITDQCNKICNPPMYVGTIVCDPPNNPCSLAPLPCAPCPPTDGFQFGLSKGNNPMSTYKTTATSTDVSLNIAPAQSDSSKARDFLMSEFDNLTRYEWRDEKRNSFAKLYNLNSPTVPRTSQEIVDAFKNGDVLIDQKKVDKQTAFFKARDNDEDFDEDYESEIGSRYYGVTFTKLPKEDRKGYDKAIEAYDKMKTDTKRKLAILDPEAGLEVLTAFEAWQPTLATASAH